MEKKYFYHVEIGRTTKKGGFLTSHSFVCSTDNGDYGSVKQHFVKKYHGFEISLNGIENIIFEPIPLANKTDMYGLTKKEKELEKELSILKAPFTETNSIKDSIKKDYFPESAKGIVAEMKVLHKEMEALRRSAEKEVRNFLFEQYKPFAESVQFVEDLKHDSYRLEYKVVLKGRLKVDFESIDEKSK